MAQHQLGVIGGGNMAEAILRGVIRSGFLDADAIVVSEPLAERREKLAGELGVAVVAENLTAAACPRVLLAVKPQVMGLVLGEIASAVRQDATVISIAAGVSTTALDEKLSRRGRIVRVMPNTPVLVGEGVSGIAAGPRATKDDLDWTRGLLVAGGGLAVVVDESQIDALTVVSGCGPAYFFYLVEAMIEAGVAEGLSEELAVQLACRTCLGAGKLLVESSEAPAELRRRVMSPGGVTQRAIERMEADGVGESLVKAIRAAAERSREMGG